MHSEPREGSSRTLDRCNEEQIGGTVPSASRFGAPEVEAVRALRLARSQVPAVCLRSLSATGRKRERPLEGAFGDDRGS